MRSRATRQFWRLFSDLPSSVHRDEDDIYSARISLDYRALAVLKGDRIIWYWIGSHAEYDRLV
jgi:hypothetical protein